MRGAVAVIHMAARQLDILDADVVAVGDPDPLALGGFAVGGEMRAAADAADDDVAGVPHRHVAAVIGGVDLDHVAVLGRLGGVARQFHVAAGADMEHAARGMVGRQRRHGQGLGRKIGRDGRGRSRYGVPRRGRRGGRGRLPRLNGGR